MCVCMCVYVKETKRMTRKSECKKEREKVCVFLGCVSFLRRTKSRRKGKRNLQERMRELKKNKKKKIKKIIRLDDVPAAPRPRTPFERLFLLACNTPSKKSN